MKKGMTAYIYRSDYDCELNKMYGKEAVTLIDPEIPGLHYPTEERPAVILVRRKIGGREYIHAEPLQPEGENKWYMSGGTFISACDGRFPHDYPIGLHDRYEG